VRDEPRRVGSRYLAESLIGRGGMGEVWRGHDVRDQRPVAVKFLRPDLVAQDDFVVRFLREARILKGLDDPRLVGITDFVAEGSSLAIVMDLVLGRDVASVLAQRGSVTLDSAVQLLDEVLQGLAAVHDANVVHGDLKPANLLLPDDGRPLVRIADFGIARMLEDAATGGGTSQVLGSPAYMAPELALGNRPDRASDLYAVGILAYELLTGAPPFHGGNPMSVLYRHTHAAPERPPGLSDELWGWISHLLAKDPAARPQDARRALDLLRAATADHVGTQAVDADGLAAHLNPPAPAGGTRVLPVPSGTQVLPSPAQPVRPAQLPAQAPGRTRRSRLTGAVIGLLTLVVLVQGVLLARGLLQPTDPAAAAPESTPGEVGVPATPTPTADRTPGVRRTAGPLPNVTGMHVTSAQDTLASYGYAVHLREQIDDSKADGEVVGQEPGAGGQPTDGSVVLTVSRRSSIVWLAEINPSQGRAAATRVDLDNRSFAHGVLLEPACAEPAGVTYSLNRRYDRLTTVLAVASPDSEETALSYRMTVDGRDVGSGDINAGDGQQVQVNLDGGGTLRIEAAAKSGSCGSARLALGDPMLKGLPD